MNVFPAVRPAISAAIQTPFNKGSGGGAASIIAGLFAQGQQGFWFPFTNFASLSQDSAGTLPYTALGQPVGRVLDRSGRGNHASQVTSTARGAVSARVNLLVKSEDFADASWIKQLTTITGNKVVEAVATGIPRVEQNFYTAVSGVLYTMTVEAQAGERFWLKVYEDSGVLNGAFFNLATKEIGTVQAAASNVSIVDLGGGRVRCSVTMAATGATFRARFAIVIADGTGAYTGDGTSGLYIYKADVRLSSPSSLPYQRVNTSSDYDYIGFPKSLLVEVDDFYTCGGGGSTTGFYYSDVIRPMGGAGTRRVIWSDRSGNNGYELAINASDKLEFSAGNGTAITAVASTVSAAVSYGKHYEVMDDGAVLSVQIDGSAPVTIARPVVTAGSSTITLYRGASTGYFNGQVTEPIYRAGPPPSAYEREVIRNYQMQKAGL